MRYAFCHVAFRQLVSIVIANEVHGDVAPCTHTQCLPLTPIHPGIQHRVDGAVYPVPVLHSTLYWSVYIMVQYDDVWRPL